MSEGKGCCDSCDQAKKRRIKSTPNRPNKRCVDENIWHKVEIEEPAFIVSLDSAPSELWYVEGEKAPDVPSIAATTLNKGRDGVGYLRCPGRWWVYWKTTGVAAKECFKVVPVGDAVSGFLMGLLEGLIPSAPGNFPALKTASKAVTGADTPTQMSTFAVPPNAQTVVKADPNNIDTVFVAGSQSCDTDAFGAYPLAPGESIAVDLANWNEIWFSSPDASAKLRCMCEAASAPQCS